MEKKPLYTIGHGSRTAEYFLSLLKESGIEYLVDVRSLPYSRFHPQFSQKNLKSFLEENGIRYIFMGDELGGRPKDPSCYNSEGKIDYELVRTKDFFLRGIERLKAAYNKDINVAIMCSESKPSECHRTRLIGKVLNEEQIILKHIDEKGKIKEHAAVEKEIKKEKKDPGLFLDL